MKSAFYFLRAYTEFGLNNAVADGDFGGEL